MSQAYDPASRISLADVLRGTLRRPGRIVACTLLGLAAGVALAKTAAPSYRTEAQILIERREKTLNEDGSKSSEVPQPIDERLIVSQVAVIQSKDFAARVVKDLALDKNEDFAPEKLAYGALKSWAVRLGFADDRRGLSRERRATDEVSDLVTVFSTRESDVITIRADASDPELSAKIANQLALQYIGTTERDEGGDNKRVRDWLSSQITELRAKVSQSEAEVEKFRSQAGLLKGTTSTLGVQEISELNTQLTLAETAQSEAAARAREIKSQLVATGSVNGSSEVLNSPVIQNLLQQRISAQRQETELAGIYLNNHPKLRAARKQIEEIDRQVRREALRVVASLDSQAKIAAERAKSLRANVEKLKQREGNANLDEVKLKSLEREATANRQLLETLLARYVEVNTRKGLELNPTLARIIQKAPVPNSVSFPRVGPIVLLSTLAGLGLGLGLAFLSAIMRMTSAGPQTVRREWFDAPPMLRQQSVPPVNSPPEVVPVAPAAVTPPVYPTQTQSVRAEDVPPPPPPKPQAPKRDVNDVPSVASSIPVNVPAAVVGVGEEALSLSGNLMQLRKANGAANFAFTRVGCEPIDSALAVYGSAKELASGKYRVLVMDLDHERAELERLFQLQDGPGLLDLLAGQSDFNKLIARDPETGIHIIRLGDVTNARQPQLLADQIRSVLRSIQGIYDFVFLHVGKATAECLPYVLTCDVAVIIAPTSHDREVVMAMDTLTQKGSIQVLHVAVDHRISSYLAHEDALA